LILRSRIVLRARPQAKVSNNWGVKGLGMSYTKSGSHIRVKIIQSPPELGDLGGK